jgi:hypothetical protein
MRGRALRGRVGLRERITLGCLLGLAGTLTGTVPGQPTAGEVLRRPLAALQLNLCNSGMAVCYTGGRAVTRAADLVREQRPDVVTLVEACRRDVAVVQRAMRGLGRDGTVVSAFRAAGDRPSGGPTRCLNGEDFGVGVVVRVPAPYRGEQVASGVYTAQDPTDPEIRVWACVVAPGQLRACVTHLAAAGGGIALAQCRQLMADGLGGGALPVLVGGDFNLGPRGRSDIRSCVPPGMTRVDDGGVQNVIVDSADFVVTGRRAADVRRTTDHPGLLVGTTFTRRIRAAGKASET